MGAYTSAAPCAEEINSCNEAYDDERGLMTASVTLRCAWGDRHTIASDILFNHRPWPKGTASLTPLAYGAGIAPASDQAGAISGQMIMPTDALVTIHYSTKKVELITESLEPTTEFVNLPPEFFTWSDGTALDDDEAPGVLKRGLNLTRTELYVNPPLTNDLITLPGSVNVAAFTSGLTGWTFDAETLLFAPPVINSKYNSIGDLQFDMVKRFTYNPNGWNTYYRADTGTWQRILLKATGGAVLSYPLADFSNILAVQFPY